MARKKAVINNDVLKNLASRMLPIKEIASILNLSPSQLNNPVCRKIIDEGYENGKSNIRFRQMEQAEKGNVVMLIWMGKQYLGQRDVCVTDAKIAVHNRKVIIDFAKLAQGDRPDTDKRGLALLPGEPMPQLPGIANASRIDGNRPTIENTKGACPSAHIGPEHSTSEAVGANGGIVVDKDDVKRDA